MMGMIQLLTYSWCRIITIMDKKTFVWHPDYSVGIQMIDEQHQHFFEIANRIILLTEAEHVSQEDLLELFGELGDYALYHLSTEENLFNDLDYPGKEQHIAAHDQYRDAIANQFATKLATAGTDVRAIAAEMAEYSGNWLREHIITVDKQYSAFFNEHGVR